MSSRQVTTINDLGGLWSFLAAAFTLVTALYAVILSRFFIRKYKRGFPGFSVHITYTCATGDAKFPNVIHIETRNLLDSPVVISRPNFRFSSNLNASKGAHGNTSTGDYELKFRPQDSNGDAIRGHSYTTMLLRHRDSAYCYIPIDDEITETELIAIMDRRKVIDRLLRRHELGIVTFNLVIFKEDKSIVFPMKVPVKNIREHPKPPMFARVASKDLA